MGLMEPALILDLHKAHLICRRVVVLSSARCAVA